MCVCVCVCVCVWCGECVGECGAGGECGGGGGECGDCGAGGECGECGGGGGVCVVVSVVSVSLCYESEPWVWVVTVCVMHACCASIWLRHLIRVGQNHT